MKPTEFTITRRIRCACGALSSSRPAPEIRERYPGTSGSTQGERNEINPAKNAAIGSGRVDMRLQLYLFDSTAYSIRRMARRLVAASRRIRTIWILPVLLL